MATLTIYANSNHGGIRFYSPLYSQVTEGVGNRVWDSMDSGYRVGQEFSGGTDYNMYEYFSQYDLSSIDGAMLILSAKEYLYLNYYSNFYSVSTVDESRIFDWTPPGGQGTYVKSDDLGGCTLLSSKTVDNTAGYHEFPSSENFIQAVSSTSLLNVVHCSTRYRTKSAPSGSEYWTWYSSYNTGTDKDPKLVVEYAYGGGSESTVGISADGAGYQALYGGSESKVYIKAVGAGYSPNVLRFLQEPVVSIQNPVATHVIVTSPTNTYTAYIAPEPAAADRIERAVTISEGNATVCQAVAEALIARWGVEQITVKGRIPLTLILDFKEYVYISIPFAGISEEMQLQSKVHTIGSSDTYTTVTLGSVYVGDNELIARILEEMG